MGNFKVLFVKSDVSWPSKLLVKWFVSPEFVQLQLANIEINEHNTVMYDFSGKTVLKSLDTTDGNILFHNMETEAETQRTHVVLSSHS